LIQIKNPGTGFLSTKWRAYFVAQAAEFEISHYTNPASLASIT